LIINVSSAAEFPGAVNYLANLLSKEGISVLHISTFESEVFLVQEKDIEKACDVMKKTDDPKEIAEMLEITNRKQQQKSSSNDKLNIEQIYHLTNLKDGIINNHHIQNPSTLIERGRS